MTLIQWVAKDPKINMDPMVMMAKIALPDHPMPKIMILMIPLFLLHEKILMTFLDVEENPMTPMIVAKDPQDLVMKTTSLDLEKILETMQITLVQIEKTAKIQDIVKEAIELQETDMVKNVVHPVMIQI